jgi:hypothetical protein
MIRGVGLQFSVMGLNRHYAVSFFPLVWAVGFATATVPVYTAYLYLGPFVFQVHNIIRSSGGSWS